MALLEDLQAIADQLSPSDLVGGDRLLGALIKVLEHNGLEAPKLDELLPEDHPARIQPAGPPAGAPAVEQSGLHDRLARIEELLAGIGHSSAPSPVTSDPGQAPQGTGAGTVGGQDAPSPPPAASPPPAEPAPPVEPAPSPADLFRPAGEPQP